ncbi:MAG TPA: IPT/TIG domain-containing protein [Gammaproteobacteria bacterium]|jgi:hypothetical protein
MRSSSFGTRVVVFALASAALGLLAGCGANGASSPPDWFYHWNCNGDSECLATNPTGAPSGTADEGPDESSCTELLTFGEHFWNIPPATQSCDHDSSGGGEATLSISGFSPASTAPGTDVTIDGSGFPTSGLSVTIDGLACTIVSVTGTEIVITLPGMGNFTGPIVVNGVSSTTSLVVVNHFFGVVSSNTQSVAVGGNTTLSGSTDGSTWRTIDLATSKFLSAIAWSGTNTYATVGEAGVVYTNTTGSASWLPQASGTTDNLFGVASSGSLFVAVGANGTVITSPDGITWTSRASHTGKVLAGVAWCTAQFIAVGDAGVIITSPDGITWTTQASGTTNFLNGVGCSGSLIAVGEGTTTANGEILTSAAGVTWTQRPIAMADAVFGIAWSGTQFVASGFGGTIYTSPDGLTWTLRNSGSTQSLNAVSWSAARSQFVAVGGYGTILTSSDGMNWTAHTP